MRRSTLFGAVAASIVTAVVIGASVVWPGLDAQETPEVDTAVWALQTGDGRRYARVNTSVGELDTVRSISNPDRVVQTGDAAYLFSDSLSKLTRIDEALPQDLDEEALDAAASTPAGTVEVATADDYVAYRTDAGAIFVGTLSAGSAGQIDPFPTEDEDAPQYAADAIAIDDSGLLYAYSRADASVLTYDIDADEVQARDALTAEALERPGISAASGRWVLVDLEDGDVWTAGAEKTTAPATGAVVLGVPDPDATQVYLADETSLIGVEAETGAMTSLVGNGTTVRGVPAAPRSVDGEVMAAWLGASDTGGVLWTEDTGDVLLSYGERSLGDQRRPVFVTGEDSVILNDTRSGWAWDVPSGQLIASSQDWSLDDRTDPEAVPSDEEREVVLDPKPPIAVADAFGVREGQLATLPVLMNDHDPNEDVLTIAPDSISGLDPEFGVVRITDNGQRLAVQVEPGASGSAQFSYAVQDGTAEDGLRSESTTVSLTVVDDAENSAPAWCGVEGCLVEWPKPEVARGGTVTVPVLPGWVDAEGDPLLLLGVENPSGVGSVAASPVGEVVYQHSDTGEGGDEVIELTVTVADTAGEKTERSLVVRVSDQPALDVESFSTIAMAGERTTIDVAEHVTGTSGTLALESVRVLDDAAASATIIAGSAQFDFTAADPGTYRVDFTVTDGITDETGTALITLLPTDAPADLATSPVLAFLYPQEDATLDVFTAVSNPTGRVLLLSDPVARAEPGSQLSVDAVGQNHLRVSGTTATGSPGRLGTVSYVISDGTEDTGARIRGQATVYLLPPAPELAPIAVDDTVVVRAGAQIDIPVLENDLAPSGAIPTLNPASIVSSTRGALAFASEDRVRYLAPTRPGDYTIDYEVFSTGAPALADGATVRVTVLAADSNRAPLPDTLEGRVLSGQAVTVEFDGYGMDPDGDAVTLDRILTQPERGAATIAADGRSILYTSVPGDRGQATFDYQIVDEFGEKGVGTARVGVLDAESNPSPITFTDYVQVQTGEGNTIRISPLANDIDPTNGTLTVTEVRPDMPDLLADGTPNAEYDRLDALVTLNEDSTVVVEAGLEPGTMSFLYDVESDSGNTGRGLIVVRVVRESVPDYPVVEDTALTVETRDDFTTGVDVLDGKVSWSGGDIPALELSLWGEPSGVSAQGWQLSGDLPAQSRLIPFEVTGMSTAGDEVTTYAFLRVPGDEDVALALRAGAPPVEVTELESVTFDMADLVAVPRGAVLEVSENVTASGARGEATCVRQSATEITYNSGANAPWSDACVVPVRLDGQEEWTYLSVPIIVDALEPQPLLKAGSMTVAPGDTATFDLRDLTSWQLREDWEGIEYAIEYGGSAFEVSQNGAQVTVTGKDRSVPGVEEAAIVSVTSHPDVATVRLILRVGAAPSTLPQGGSVTEQCSQAEGSSCSITVIGASGEVNPLPGTPLEVVDVRTTGACVGVSFAVSGPSQVTANWSGDAPGATCTATYSVIDAQGRTTTSQRDGRILLDLLGFPKGPASVSQTAYGDGSVTLRVDPGEARQAYPALTGFVVRVDGETVLRCAADGTCPDIESPNGEKRTYEVTAISDVGESKSSVSTVAWAYDPPAAPSAIDWRPVATSGEGGVVSLTIEGIDSTQTGTVELTSPTGPTVRLPVSRNQTTIEVRSYAIGTNTATPITATPYSRFEIPNGLPGNETGASKTVSVNGVGKPLNVSLDLSTTSNDDDTVNIRARVTATVNGDGSTLRYSYGVARVEGNSEPRCTVDDGSVTTFERLETGYEYRVIACVESIWRDASFGRAEASNSIRAEQSGDAPRGWTFSVDPNGQLDGQQARWFIQAEPSSSERPPRFNEPVLTNWGPGTTVFDRDPNIRVHYRHRLWGTTTNDARVQPASGSAPYQVQASWSVTCEGGSALATSARSTDGVAAVNFANDALVYRDKDGAVLPYEGWTVPVGAVSVEGIKVAVDWTSTGWNLRGVNTSFGGECDPNIPPPPEPTPTPTPTPTDPPETETPE